MRIKWGDQWIEAKPGIPIMVELTKKDLENIANMHSDATKYASFDDSDTTTPEQKIAWMNQGAGFELDSAEFMEAATKTVGPDDIEAYLRDLKSKESEKWEQAKVNPHLESWFVNMTMNHFGGKLTLGTVRKLMHSIRKEETEMVEPLLDSFVGDEK